MSKVGKALGCALALLLSALGAPARAGVSVDFDLEALNELLPAMAVQDVHVPIAGGRSLRIQVEDLRILALSPASATAPDRILTSLRLKVPSLGLDLPLEPTMSLTAVEEEGQSWLELGFGQVRIPLPLGASVDAAPFLTPIRFPAEELFRVEGARGDLWVRSRLREIRMSPQDVRFDFDLTVVEPGATE